MVLLCQGSEHGVVLELTGRRKKATSNTAAMDVTKFEKKANLLKKKMSPNEILQSAYT